MLPLGLDIAQLPVVLIGRGEPVLKRLALLDAAGAGALTVYCDAPPPGLAAVAGHRLNRRLANAADLVGARLVLIAGLDLDASTALTETARRAGALVNVEDQKSWCDFHSPSVVRRGDLLLSVSTNGQSPALARLVRTMLEALFPAVWADRVVELGRLRRRLRAHGFAAEVASATEALLAKRNRLPVIDDAETRRHAHR